MIKNAIKKAIVFVVEGLYYHPRVRYAVLIILLILSYPLSAWIDSWWIPLMTR